VSAADEVPKGTIKEGLEDLHATSDKVIFDSAEHYAEMIGNVKVTQGETVITANTLKIHYHNNKPTTPNQLPGNDTVEKIVAKGNVRIELDSGIALSDEAVYHTDIRELILTGGAKLIRGENTISGSKITINRKNGRVTVESSDKKPVEAFIFSNEKI
jgi:lipopolysaccharide export system protein LptA